MLQFVLSGQLKLLMGFILYEWVIMRSEIIIAIFRKSMTSVDQNLNGKLVVAIEIPSGPYMEIGGYNMQCYSLSFWKKAAFSALLDFEHEP